MIFDTLSNNVLLAMTMIVQGHQSDWKGRQQLYIINFIRHTNP